MLVAEDVSLRELAESCPEDSVKQAAQKLFGHLQELELGEDVGELLEQPISPAAHTFACRLQKIINLGGKNVHAADVALYDVLSIRGAVALLSGSRISSPYEQDELPGDINKLTNPMLIHAMHSKGLGPATYGERTDEKPAYPLRGMLYGYNSRPMFSIIVEDEGKAHKLPFLFDTGGQVTSLSEEGWAVVAPGVDVSKWKTSEAGAINYTFLKVHGLSMPVYLSLKNAKGANILGNHFADKAGVTFVGAYAQGGCLLASGDRPLVEQLPMLPRI